jgi:hypothetical protein
MLLIVTSRAPNRSLSVPKNITLKSFRSQNTSRPHVSSRRSATPCEITMGMADRASPFAAPFAGLDGPKDPRPLRDSQRTLPSALDT